MRRPIRFAFGIVALQIAYLAVTFVAWKFLGYQSGIADGVTGILVSFIAWVVNPILCAYTANELSLKKRKTITVSVFFVYLVTASVFKYVSYLTWIHASGYYAYLLIPNQKIMNFETLAVNEFGNMVGVIVTVIVFAGAYFYISRVRSKNRTPDL